MKYIAECGRRYLLGLALLPAVTFYIVWPHVPLWSSVSWFLASLLVAAFRYFLVFKVQKLGDDMDASYWGGQLTLSSFLSGCLWGLAAMVFFVPDSLGLQLYILLTVFVLTSMTMFLYSYWISAYYAFTVPSLVGVIIALLRAGSVEHDAFALLTILYGGIVIQVARNQKQLVRESMMLRFQNADLVEELITQKNVAEAANLSKSKFLAAASHDLRQPLHSIGLFSAALANRPNSSVERSMIKNIDSSVASLDSLLNALLDISKLDAGVVSPQFQHIDLAALIARLAAEYAPHARAKRLALNIDDCDAVVYCDIGLLETILRNLISNAIRYTDEGAIAIVSRPDSDHVLIKIIDTGAGIPASQQQKIFQEFYQVSNSGRDNSAGVGLGLAIVKRLTTILNIDVQVSSVPQVGSEFTLRLDRGDAKQVAKPIAPQSFIPHDGAGTLVLVIDDHPEVRMGMKALLKSWNYKVLGARSEKDALRALSLAKVTPDVVLIDYQLGTAVGTEVLKALNHQLNAPFDAIILTGDTSQKCIVDAHASGYKVLHKPVAPAKLRAMLIRFKVRTAAG